MGIVYTFARKLSNTSVVEHRRHDWRSTLASMFLVTPQRGVLEQWRTDE